MRRFFFAVLVIGATTLSVPGSQPAPADAVASGCGAVNGATFTTTVSQAFITGPFQFNVGDQVVYNLTFTFSSFTPTVVSVQIGLGQTFSPVASATFANSPTSATVAYTFTSAQSTVLGFEWGFSGIGSFSPHTITTHISCGSTIYGGPPIPSGFVLRTITCNTPVYESAGGRAVSTGEAITAGQTWFVSPTPVTVGGTSWTEIFVSGTHNVFIQTSCVGDKPAGYGGA
jgi:hypothetical protein